MEKNQLAQLSESGIEGLSKDIASMSVSNALALLNGIARAFLEQEFPNNRGISLRSGHAHGISMAVNMRLFECISLLGSIVAGRVESDHKLNHEEQVLAGEARDLEHRARQQQS